jgi:hypothetical protein
MIQIVTKYQKMKLLTQARLLYWHFTAKCDLYLRLSLLN